MWNIESTSWSDLAEEDIGDRPPEEQSSVIDYVGMLRDQFRVIFGHKVVTMRFNCVRRDTNVVYGTGGINEGKA